MSQCHPPPQGGTGCGKMDDISPSPTVGPALSRPGANKKKKKESDKKSGALKAEIQIFHIRNYFTTNFACNKLECLTSNGVQIMHFKNLAN